MSSENIILGDELEERTLTDLLKARFRTLAKEYLQYDITDDEDLGRVLKENSRFFGFSLPAHVSEFFIKYEDAPVFWVYNSPLNIYLEDMLKGPGAQSISYANHKSIKDFYTKWVLIRSDSEKRYFASSTINQIEKKTSKDNFFYLILQGIILTYEKSLFNPVKAQELFSSALELINLVKINDVYKIELKYLVLLYFGFLFLKQDLITEAQAKFNEALEVKPFGITAKFYNTLMDTKIRSLILSEEIIREIYNFDLDRLGYAIENNSLNMLDYFLRRPVLSNLFFYLDFSASLEVIETFLRDTRGSFVFDPEGIRIDINNFNNLNVSDYQDESIKKNLVFIETVIKNFTGTTNMLFLATSDKIEQKFLGTLETVYESVRQKYYGEIKEKLKIYDAEIYEKQTELNRITAEQEQSKNKLKEKLNSAINNVERSAAESVAVLEERINNIQMIKSLDPKNSFKNAMTYNLILSFTVFLMGGCAGYSNNFMGDIWKFDNLFSIVIVYGLKWALISFLIGLVVSLISAGSTMLEGSNYRQKLLRTITALKNEKDRKIEYLKKEGEQNEKLLVEKYTKNVEELRVYIENLKNEKMSRERELLEDAEKKIKDESGELEKLIKANKA